MPFTINFPDYSQQPSTHLRWTRCYNFTIIPVELKRCICACGADGEKEKSPEHQAACGGPTSQHATITYDKSNLLTVHQTMHSMEHFFINSAPQSFATK